MPRVPEDLVPSRETRQRRPGLKPALPPAPSPQPAAEALGCSCWAPPPPAGVSGGLWPPHPAGRVTDSGMCTGRATGSGEPPPAREGPTPTPEALDDVQGGAPGEALAGAQLQPGQGAGQRLQLIGPPLPPVQKHAEAGMGPRGPGAVGTGAAAGLRGPWAWPGAAGSASPGREQAGSGGGGPGADQWPGPGPTQSAFLPLLQHFTNFHFPAPSEPPRRGRPRLGTPRPGKGCDCSRGSSLR